MVNPIPPHTKPTKQWPGYSNGAWRTFTSWSDAVKSMRQTLESPLVETEDDISLRDPTENIYKDEEFLSDNVQTTNAMSNPAFFLKDNKKL